MPIIMGYDIEELKRLYAELEEAKRRFRKFYAELTFNHTSGGSIYDMLEKARQHGWLDDQYKPTTKLSRPQAAMLAEYIDENALKKERRRFKDLNKWDVWEVWWERTGMSSDHNKGITANYAKDFRKKLQEVLG